MQSSLPVVETRGLGKRYGDFVALADCDLAVPEGEIFGLLGPNGAGKTTLIRSLLGFLQRTSGECSVCGIDPAVDSVEVRRRVAYLPGDARLPRHLRGEAVLKFFSKMHPQSDLRRSLEIAERLELDRSRRVGMMSTGMRQKLALAAVLGTLTPLVILDEPTANLDPSVRGEVLDLVVEARDRGQTVMLSSHVLSEIEDTCDRVVFLRSGHVARHLLMSDLFQRHRVLGRSARDAIEVPESWADSVVVRRLETTPADRPPGASGYTGASAYTGARWSIETAGDLAPYLGWIQSLELSELRIEPVGLRTIYNEVHRSLENVALKNRSLENGALETRTLETAS
ncbi:MAG: ABC transporter ATP-binding protein [Planctomycetota bacterium]